MLPRSAYETDIPSPQPGQFWNPTFFNGQKVKSESGCGSKSPRNNRATIHKNGSKPNVEKYSNILFVMRNF